MNRLQERRKELGYSQNELAVKSGVGLGTIRKYEIGERDISIASVDIVYKLAQALNTTVEYLIGK